MQRFRQTPWLTVSSNTWGLTAMSSFCSTSIALPRRPLCSSTIRALVRSADGRRDLAVLSHWSPTRPQSRPGHRPPQGPLFKANFGETPLDLSWPAEVISLSHVALPIPPDDPLYGQRVPENDKVLFLGEMAIRGERGLLRISSEWLLRLRYNPFYDFLESRTVASIHNANDSRSGNKGAGLRHSRRWVFISGPAWLRKERYGSRSHAD